MIKEFTDSNFNEEVLKVKGKVLVDVFANWCGPCKTMSPIIEDIANVYEGKVKVGKIDVDKNPDTPARYSILSIPTFLFFKDGQLVDQHIGVISKQELQKKIEMI